MPTGQNAASTRCVLHALSAVFGLGVLVPGTNASAAEPGQIVVVATRVAEPGFELPVAVDRVGRSAIVEGQPAVNLSESLPAVPGLSVQSRQNYAQDLQLSIRGFGARSSFGVRGVRLYADGIPGTMPDGQGQFAQFDLGSAERIEVLRGPFSVLYGNSSGGVLAIFTEDGRAGSELTATAGAGSFDTRRYALKDSGESGRMNYLVDASHFATAGYRTHSGAERSLFNAKLRLSLEDGSRLTLVANLIDMPNVADPLGLTRVQLADPSQAGTNAVLYDTRKSLRQEQSGAVYERGLGPFDSLSASVYAGSRATTQFQAILRSAELRPTHPGGVIDLSRNYWGTDAHVTDVRGGADSPLQVTAGLSFDDLSETRRGYLNYAGTALGVVGALRRDDANEVYDLDEYAEARWDPNARVRALVGVRNSVVHVSSHSKLPSAGTSSAGGPGIPGSIEYSALNPVAGITLRARANLNLYAAFGTGFETPTLNDLAYRSTDGSLPGLNLGLEPARSKHYETGVKAATGPVSAEAAVFYVTTRHELAVAANAAGRSVFANIGETARRGAELALDAVVAGFSARVAYTYLRALTAAPYSTCVGLPCTNVVIPAGRRLPAVPANSLYAGLTWRDAAQHFSVTVDTQGRASIPVDDRNSDAAAGYWVTNVRAGMEQRPERWRFTEFLRVDNVLNRRYAGSVIVNESNGRFFEPAPGRTVYLVFTAARRSP
jgi:iron complex outermembrane receptor protein